MSNNWKEKYEERKKEWIRKEEKEQEEWERKNGINKGEKNNKKMDSK